jgi:CubicO group peptidase (beta-lactamase class C family)
MPGVPGISDHLVKLIFDNSEMRMNVCPRRWVLISVFTLVAALGCSPTATSPSPSSPPTTPPSAATSSMPTGGSAPEYAALEAEIEKAISTGPATLDSVRAVLVNVDGETKIAHYRHGFTGNDYGHVFSVTKSVLSILIGIAIADGLIDDIDRPLIELLPKHREAMSGDRDATKVTLRHLMTMSGGFNEFPGGFVWQEAAKPGNSFIDVLLKRRQRLEPGKVFWYSDASAHLVSAVLEAALERADGADSRTVLDYAREKLFDPLGIPTHPSYSGPLPDALLTPDFVTADFGWGTDPNGIELGGFGLRLTAPDMMKIGELYRLGGVWNGQQIVPSAWIRRCTSAATFETEVGGIPDLDYGLFWWIITKPRGAGYLALGFGGQRILVLPKSRAVIVYLTNVQSDSYIDDGRDLEPLDKVLDEAFLR